MRTLMEHLDLEIRLFICTCLASGLMGYWLLTA